MNKKNLPYILPCFIVLFLTVSALITACGGGGGDDPPNGAGVALLIETDNSGDADLPHVAMDSGGNAISVWQQSDGGTNHIWANRYVAGTGWGTAERIDNDPAGAYIPKVAMSPGGSAIAVWRQPSSIWANHYEPGTGWGTAVLIESGSKIADIPQVAMDSSGNAIAVWKQADPVYSSNSVYANRYAPGTGWEGAALLEASNSPADKPRIAFDAAGNAIAVWEQWEGALWNIFSNRYDSDTGWEGAILIENENVAMAYSPVVAFDSSGDAMAVWYQQDGVAFSIWANLYVSGTGWEGVMLVKDGLVNYVYPQVAMDSGGNAIAVWSHWDGTRDDLWASRYVAGTGWGTAENIETGAGNALSPALAMDSNGNAVAVWHQSEGGMYSIMANHYVAGTGWGTAGPIEDGSGPALNPHVAMNTSGKAIAVWSQYDSNMDSIWAYSF